MRVLHYVLPLLCLFALLAPSAAAGDETPAEKPEMWTYEKGDETRQLMVTRMSEQLRNAIDAQLRSAGWTRVKGAVEKAKGESGTPEGSAAEAGGAQLPPDKKPISPDTESDIAELVRRGGRLPEGFVPHGVGPGAGPGGVPPGGPPPGRAGPLGGGLLGGAGSAQMMGALTKATGKLLLRYLEVKDDAVKGPVYEEILRTIATALVDEKGADMQQIGMRMMGSFMAGMQDPKKGPVYREIMAIFSQAMAAGAQARPAPGPKARAATPPPPAPSSPPAPQDGPFADAPTELGGALLAYMVGISGNAAWVVTVVKVPPDSTAAAAGLAAGDKIEAIDGQPVDPARLKRAQGVLSKGGQLNLRLRRKDGSVEELELDVSLAD